MLLPNTVDIVDCSRNTESHGTLYSGPELKSATAEEGSKMSLFGQYAPAVRNGYYPGPRRPQRPPMAAPVHHEVVCTCRDRHHLPVRMVCIAESVSDHGAPMAVFGCPFSGCLWREGWVRDWRTGRPIRLWAGRHDGR